MSPKYIGVTLVVDGGFKNVNLPVKFVEQLAETLRTKGPEEIHTLSESFTAEGMYIPAKGAKHKMILISDEEETK